MSVSNMWEYTYDPDDDGGDNNSNNCTTSTPNDETTTLSSYSYHSSRRHQPWWQEPIVVGYAFGPKKMSTMGVVMAEASQADIIHEEQEEDFLLYEHQQQEQYHDEPQSPTTKNSCMLTTANVEGLGNDNSKLNYDSEQSQGHQTEDQEQQQGKNQQQQKQSQHQHQQTSPQRPHTIIRMASDKGDIKHIVRYFRSSCSSATGSITETTVSTPTLSSNPGKHLPVRISFVPLDPDVSLKEQHGGKFDLILHKLTEDILSIAMDDQKNHHPSNEAARARVQTLLDYKNAHECCCLVDDPNYVQALMNRSDISKTLEKCLQNVTSASGHPVRTPRFVVVDDDHSNLRTKVDQAQLHVPLIVKPLIAAGTKQSHHMTIVLQDSAFDDEERKETKIPSKSLIQQYENHNATLYKVYVMGEYVHVYHRPSLPDLPIFDSNITSSIDLLEFDSQRPYPRLQDFGFASSSSSSQEQRASPSSPTGAEGALTTTSSTKIDVTPDEVRPVVEALKQAFGLELFGFDILISSSTPDHYETIDEEKDQDKRAKSKQQWLVVDVNYFPSYKEVPNFPSLLAQYLTNRVLQQRRRTLLLRRQEEETEIEEESTDDHHIHDRETIPTQRKTIPCVTNVDLQTLSRLTTPTARR